MRSIVSEPRPADFRPASAADAAQLRDRPADDKARVDVAFLDSLEKRAVNLEKRAKSGDKETITLDSLSRSGEYYIGSVPTALGPFDCPGTPPLDRSLSIRSASRL